MSNSELEALKKDAERYRFLKESVALIATMVVGGALSR